jgi:hypothetical protein
VDRGGCHACGRALSSVASLSAGGAEAWAAASPVIDGCGTRRDSGPRRGSVAASSGRLSAERLAERGARDEPCELRVGSPGACRGANWAPQAVRPRAGDAAAKAIVRQSVARAGLVAGLVFHAIAVSLDDDRLPVVHQPIDHGGGQGVVHIEDRAPIPEGSVGGNHD